MLVSTLDDLLKESKGKRGSLTCLLLLYNKRISDEIFESVENKELMEYFGLRVPQDKNKENSGEKY